MQLLFENWRQYLKENENKIVAYHGSDRPITEFSREFGAQGVMWFSEDKDKIVRGESGACSSKYIMTVELDVKNPAGWSEYDKLFLQQIEEQGYDSIKLDDNWVMFDPTKIKVTEIEEPTCKLKGYKIVAYEDGKLYSLQNPDLEYRAKVGTVESPSGGMFLGTTKDFVVDYYGEMTDKHDALLVYEYSPGDVISGQPDEEGEVKVTTAKLLSMEILQ
tara:strand:- start:607 stop:1260 length:654 start_codon:yes stop_codon:yes gene_type:complete